MTEIPTPPAPNTTTDEPGVTCAVFKAAPVPVVTAQPSNAARSSGISSAILTTARSCNNIFSAKDARSANCATGAPFCDNRGLASLGRRQAARLLHRWVSPDTHCAQDPQYIEVQAIIWSPGLTVLTSLPTASIIPAGSWPRTPGVRTGRLPCRACRSLWHTPLAAV